MGEESLLGDAAAARGEVRLTPQQVAITWRGDARYVATLVQPGPPPPALDGTGSCAASPAGAEAGSTAALEQPTAADPTPAAPQGREKRAGFASNAQTQKATEGARSGLTRLHVWLRDGCALHATGEEVKGLLPVAAWQPNGRHLYVGQATPQGPCALLFETNGLQHGGFQLADQGAPAAAALSDPTAQKLRTRLQSSCAVRSRSSRGTGLQFLACGMAAHGDNSGDNPKPQGGQVQQGGPSGAPETSQAAGRGFRVTLQAPGPSDLPSANIPLALMMSRQPSGVAG